MGLFLKKNNFLRGWVLIFAFNWICIYIWMNFYIALFAKTASTKIGALICSMKFFSPWVAIYLYTFTIQPCSENCYHVWAGATSCYLDMLDKLQKRICTTVSPSLTVSTINLPYSLVQNTVIMSGLVLLAATSIC